MKKTKKKYRISKPTCWVVATTKRGESGESTFAYRERRWIVSPNGCGIGTTPTKSKAKRCKTAAEASAVRRAHIRAGGNAAWWAVYRRGVAS